MRTRALVILVGAVLFSGCGSNPSSDPSPLRLGASVSPNPLSRPDAEGNVFWTLDLRASGSGTVLVERADVLLLDAAGARVGETKVFYSRSAGCSVCTTDLTLASGVSRRFNNDRVKLARGGGTPVRFVYTVFYSDDLGSGSITVEVPVSTL
jgi:hypothetical protein